jgi:hypothetical protein
LRFVQIVHVSVLVVGLISVLSPTVLSFYVWQLFIRLVDEVLCRVDANLASLARVQAILKK